MRLIKSKVAAVEFDNWRTMRNRLHTIEGLATERYFSQIFQLLPKALSISRRRTFKAYTGIDNTFNLAYTVLKWKAYRAIIKAKLEPYLGFLHSQAVGKPSLVCDLMESYRYLIDDFLIQYCKALKKKDFTMKNEDYSTNRKGQREYLSKPLAQDMMNKLNSFFESKIEIQRIRRGNKQSLETLINEEALLLAKYLRNERKAWSPRTSEGCL